MTYPASIAVLLRRPGTPFAAAVWLSGSAPAERHVLVVPNARNGSIQQRGAAVRAGTSAKRPAVFAVSSVSAAAASTVPAARSAAGRILSAAAAVDVYTAAAA